MARGVRTEQQQAPTLPCGAPTPHRTPPQIEGFDTVTDELNDLKKKRAFFEVQTAKQSDAKCRLLDERLQKVTEEKTTLDDESHSLHDTVDTLTAKNKECAEGREEDKKLIAALQSALSKTGDEATMEVAALKAALLAGTWLFCGATSW